MASLEAIWYGDASPPWHWRLGSYIYLLAGKLRRCVYTLGILPIHRFTCPVIIVGNITAGGTGKTPLVLWLAERLQMAGFRPGIIGRGYGGSYSGAAELVTAQSDPEVYGDEAVLCAMRSGLPVAVGRQRWRAGSLLLEKTGVNVLISDDGLQHAALARDLEICVIDGARRFGNGRLIPAGPLRESVTRLKSADFVVANGTAQKGEVEMHLKAHSAWSLSGSEQRSLAAFKNERLHAIAGIGNPVRFFATLREHDLQFTAHEFPDHHKFRPHDLDFNDNAVILMTEKDAVKCKSFGLKTAWAVPVQACLQEPFAEEVMAKITAAARRKREFVKDAA